MKRFCFRSRFPLARSPSRIPARKERQPFRRPDGRVRTRRRRVRRRSLPAGKRHAEKEIPAATAGDVPEAVAEIPAGACAETAEAPQDGCATAAAEALPDGEDSVEQKLFDDEPVTRHRVDKRVILSLYGDVPAASPYPASASYRKHEEAAGLPTVSEPEGISSHTAVPDGGTARCLPAAERRL